MSRIGLFFLSFIFFFSGTGNASEMPTGKTRVIEKTQSRTGIPYRSIVSEGKIEEPEVPRFYARPDYRLLSSDRYGEVVYEGPVSDRKKVYLFAGTVAAVGVAGGTLGMLAASSSTAAASAGGGTGYLAGGGAVLAGSLAGGLHTVKRPPQEDYDLKSQAQTVE